MPKLSAGIILYKLDDTVLNVLIGHMGGPLWARKDDRGWSILKGEYDEGENPEAVAAREFTEETGQPLPPGPLVPLGALRQRGGKQVTAYALQADFDPAHTRSNTFEMEWPPGSGNIRSFPEIDRVAWFDAQTARAKLIQSQTPFLDRLLEHVRTHGITVRETERNAPP